MTSAPPSYRIVARLGRGGTGAVYRAVERGADGFEREVALKVLAEPASPAALARFRDEARLGRLVPGRAFVRTGAPSRWRGRWIVVLDLVDGWTLDRLVARGALPARPALEIVAECARALDAAARAVGLVHRDLKPGNLMLTPSGEVRVLDLGIAQASFPGREAATEPDAVPGTPGYVAPERRRGETSAAGDVWSLGVVLAELVARDRTVTAADAAPPEVDGLHALVAAMRDEDPAARPPMREVERRATALASGAAGPSLREWAEQHVPAGPAGDLDDPLIGAEVGGAEVGGADLGPAALGPDDVAPARRRRGIAAVGILAAACAAGAALVALPTSRPAPSPPLAAAPPPPARLDPAPAPPPEPAAEPPPIDPLPTASAPSPSPVPVWVKTRPYGEVRVAGRRWDTEDPAMALPPGPHTLELRAHDGRRRSWPIVVRPGADNAVCWDFGTESPCSSR